MPTTTKKMISALMASLVIDEPQVGPTVVTLTLSVGTVVVVVVVEVAPDLAVVVVAPLVDVVVACEDEPGWWPVRRSIASWTFWLTWFWLACESLLRSAWTLRVCRFPLPSSSTVGSITPVPFRASTA